MVKLDSIFLWNYKFSTCDDKFRLFVKKICMFSFHKKKSTKVNIRLNRNLINKKKNLKYLTFLTILTIIYIGIFILSIICVLFWLFFWPFFHADCFFMHDYSLYLVFDKWNKIKANYMLNHFKVIFGRGHYIKLKKKVG